MRTPITDAAKVWAYPSPSGDVAFEPYGSDESAACVPVRVAQDLEIERNMLLVALEKIVKVAPPYGHLWTYSEEIKDAREAIDRVKKGGNP